MSDISSFRGALSQRVSSCFCALAAVVADAAGTYALSFEINGRGMVAWTVDGKPCDERCREELKTGAIRIPAGALVEIVATADPGWALDRWTDCPADPGEPSRCRLTMTQATTVGATFRPFGPPVLRPEIGGQSVSRLAPTRLRVQFTTDQAGTARVSLVRCSRGATDCDRYTVIARAVRQIRMGVARIELNTPLLRPAIYRARILEDGVSGRTSYLRQKTLVVRHRR